MYLPQPRLEAGMERRQGRAVANHSKVSVTSLMTILYVLSALSGSSLEPLIEIGNRVSTKEPKSTTKMTPSLACLCTKTGIYI